MKKVKNHFFPSVFLFSDTFQQISINIYLKAIFSSYFCLPYPYQIILIDPNVLGISRITRFKSLRKFVLVCLQKLKRTKKKKKNTACRLLFPFIILGFLSGNFAFAIFFQMYFFLCVVCFLRDEIPLFLSNSLSLTFTLIGLVLLRPRPLKSKGEIIATLLCPQGKQNCGNECEKGIRKMYKDLGTVSEYIAIIKKKREHFNEIIR